MNLKKIILYIFIFLLILLSLCILIFAIQFVKNNQKYLRDKIKKESIYINPTKIRDINNLNKVIENTTAQGVLVYDLKNNKILGYKNIDKVYSLASLTKIITANLAYEKSPYLLNDIRQMLKTSNNQDAERIAKTFATSTYDQIKYVNSVTSKYDLYFRNVTGLDVYENNNIYPGGEGRPLDIIYFIKDYYYKYPEIFDQTIKRENNTNIIVNDLRFLSISKTGYTDLSGGNLFVSIQKGLDREIFILVLNSTEKNRFVDVQNIADFLIQSSI